MGALSEDQLFISPFMSLIVVLLVMLLMQVGSNYFARMQQVPLHAWPVLDIFRGDLFDRNARMALLALDSKAQQGSAAERSSLGGLRTLVAMSCDVDISIQQRVASSLVTLLELAQSVSQPQRLLVVVAAVLVTVVGEPSSAPATPAAPSLPAAPAASAALLPPTFLPQGMSQLPVGQLTLTLTLDLTSSTLTLTLTRACRSCPWSS